MSGVRFACTASAVRSSVLFIVSLLALAGAESALAQCAEPTVTVTSQAELESAIADFNSMCGIQDKHVTVEGTIIMVSAPPAVTNGAGASLVLTGDGDDVIDGGGSFRILEINNGLVQVDTLTLQNALGSAIAMTGGALIATDSVFASNSAFLLGGAILMESQAWAHISASTFSDNLAGYGGSATPGLVSHGGAIAVDGSSLTVVDSTFTGNRADNTTGGTHGGAIHVMGASAGAEIINSTFTNNSGSQGGAFHVRDGATLTLTNSTVSGNTGSAGAVYSSGSTLVLNNSILANQQTGGSPASATSDCVLAASPPSTVVFSAGMSNLVHRGSDCGTPGVDFVQADPLLGVLQDNGGGVQTMLPEQSSPVINAGDNASAVDDNSSPLVTDGRGAGFPRILHGVVDLGAVEVLDEAAPALVSLSPVDDATNIPGTPTLTATFDQDVQAGAGNLTLHRVSDDGVVAAFDASSDVAYSGPEASFIVPSPLNDLTEYYVLIPDGAITDTNGIAFEGIYSTTAWNFTTGDATPPLVTGRSPNHLDNGVAVTTDIVITLGEPVALANAGTIEIIETGAGSFEVFDLSVPADAARVSVNGVVVTITPSQAFDEWTDYHVLISAGAITDLAGNGFAGYSNASQYAFSTGDATPPMITALVPADNAIDISTDVSGTQNLRVFFNEQVGASGTGSISLYRSQDNVLVESIAIDGARASFFLNSPTEGGFDVDLQVGLEAGTGYYVQIDPGAVVDAANNPNAFPGITDTTSWNFTTIDTVAPQLVALTPANGSTDVATDTSLVLVFDETVQAGYGDLTIHRVSDNGVVEAIPVDSGRVSYAGDTVTVDPFYDLEDSTAYYVQLLPGVIRDTATTPNDFGGILASSDWQFTTGDFVAPSVLALAPANGSVDVTVDTSLSLTFDEDVQAGAGDVTIHRVSDDSIVETIAVDAGNVTFAGDTVTIDPSADLEGGVAFYVLVAGGAITDAGSGPNAFAGIADSSSWRFTTIDTEAPQIMSLAPANGATGVVLNPSLVVTFDENVQAGSGNVTIHRGDDDTVIEAIAVDSGNVTFMDETVTITLTDELATGTEYYVQVVAGSVTDLATTPNPFAGITGTTAWRFTTGDAVAPEIVSLSPADDTTDIATDSDLVMTFNEAVQAGSGDVTLHLASDDTVMETITIGSAQVTFAGDTVTIDPPGTLLTGTEYYVQVAAGAITDMGDPANAFAGIAGKAAWSFTTEGDDGLDDETENQAPNNGDGNADGVPDRHQDNVASFPGSTDACFLTVEAPEGTLVTRPRTVDVPADVPDEFDFPCGMLAFDLEGLVPGGAVDIAVHVFPANADLAAYIKFNQQEQLWADIATETLAQGDSTLVRLTLSDGGPFDVDGVVNGVISDPGGPATMAVQPPVPPPPPPLVRPAHPIPAASAWGMLLLILSMGAVAGVAHRRMS